MPTKETTKRKGRKADRRVKAAPEETDGCLICLRLFDERMAAALDSYAMATYKRSRTRNIALNAIIERALRESGHWPPPGE